MSKQINSLLRTTAAEQACAQAIQQFADYRQQFQLSCRAVERIEQNLSKLALAANLAAARPQSHSIHADDGAAWHKNVALMENVYLCHRPVKNGTEYAAVEHFPARHINEIWNRGPNAVQVLIVFVREQRQALEIWSADLSAQVAQFLVDKYPGQDLVQVADRFWQWPIHEVNVEPLQPAMPNPLFIRG
jgi:hypothetical protein